MSPARPVREKGGTVILINPKPPRPLPLCRSGRAPAQHPPRPRRPEAPAIARCVIPRHPPLTTLWAATPTPARPNTTPAPGRASGAITAISSSSVTCANSRVEPVPRPTGLKTWLACLPGRLGDQLFTMNDAEASWRGWQITKVYGGFGRRNRDPRFDGLSAHPDEAGRCAGAGNQGPFGPI